VVYPTLALLRSIPNSGSTVRIESSLRWLQEDLLPHPLVVSSASDLKPGIIPSLDQFTREYVVEHELNFLSDGFIELARSRQVIDFFHQLIFFLI
jgi:hypothetical protein